MCNKTMEENLYNLEHATDKYKTKELYNRAVEEDPYTKKISDMHKTQETCNNAVRQDPYSLEFVPVHLYTQEIAP